MEEIYLIIEMKKEEYELCKEHYQMGSTVSFATKLIANGKPVMKLKQSTVDYLDKVHKARKRKEAEKLKEAIQLTECISIDYEDRTKEEIEELDDALDVIFGCARERLKELKKEAEE